MIERFDKDSVFRGNDFPVVDNGDGIENDVQFSDIEANAPDDAALIDDVISGYEHKDTVEHTDIKLNDAHELAQRALYLLDKDPSSESVRTSVLAHPSMHRVPDEYKESAADSIIRAYKEEMRRYKEAGDPAQMDYDVHIAIIRNLEHLDEHDLERIAVMMGYDKDHFKPKVRPVTTEEEDRPRDAHERQLKD